MSIKARLLCLLSTVFCLPLLYTGTAAASFSGTNGKILYTKWSSTLSPENTYNQTDDNLYIANSDGSDEQLFGRVADYPDINFSPDGAHILYREQMDSDIYGSNFVVSNLDGTDKHIVYSGYFVGHPRFLSDGNSLAFENCLSSTCAATAKLNFGEVDNTPLINNIGGRISPNGDAYVTLPNNGTSVVQYASGLNGTNANQSLSTIYGPAGSCMWTCLSSVSWSPDNTHVAFWRYIDLNTYSLVILNTHTNQSSEHSYAFRPRSLVWSPDGNSVLATGDKSSTVPYYGYPFNPKLVEFNLSSEQFTVLNVNLPESIVDWQPLGTPLNYPTLPDNPPSNQPTKLQVYRLVNWITHERLFTTNYAEIAYAQQHYAGWVYEGVALSAYESQDENNTPVYRLVNWITHERLFTTNYAEIAYAQQHYAGWVYEGVAFYASTSPSDTPVYRLANWITHERLFTSNYAEIAYAQQHYTGWVYEGIAFYTPSS